MIELTVIIPMYNSEDTIAILLKELEKLADTEIIVIDDGSSDNSVKIVTEIKNTANVPIKLIKEEHKGASNARNKGISKAEGRFIIFVDADDRVNANKLQNIITEYRDTEADIISVSNNIEERTIVNKFDKDKLVREILGIIPRNGFLPSPWSKIFKSSLLKDNEISFPLNVIVGEDMLFNIESVLKSKCISIINDSYYLYYVNSKSITHKTTYDILANSKTFISNLEDRVRDKKIFTEATIRSWEIDSVKSIENNYSRKDLITYNRYIARKISVSKFIISKRSVKRRILQILLLIGDQRGTKFLVRRAKSHTENNSGYIKI